METQALDPHPDAGWARRKEYFAWGERAPLPPGPWSDEPSKVQWLDPTSNLDCLIVRGPLGALCGYVGVPPSHPLFGTHYGDEAASHLEAHGGLTFSESCDEAAPEATGICHVPLPGRPCAVWWFGFDCLHAFDEIPGMPRQYQGPDTTYRNIAHVRAEVERLAGQLGGGSGA